MIYPEVHVLAGTLVPVMSLYKEKEKKSPGSGSRHNTTTEAGRPRTLLMSEGLVFEFFLF
jgi:hypothetical protein